MLFYRAALPLSRKTPHLCGRDHPPPPEVDRVVVAEAEPLSAGLASRGH
jgi:hypothetical protein